MAQVTDVGYSRYRIQEYGTFRASFDANAASIAFFSINPDKAQFLVPGDSIPITD